VEEELIKWKTNAWKNPDMVAWYHSRMQDNRGTNKLKNQVELALCERFAVGPKLLDIGVGTGRGSLPLARAGYDVTGIDSSQAMLDQTRVLAGETPIRLLQGDLADLPFADGEFDTAMALNVMVHFPNWREILAQWRRVVRPGGRIRFDIHSQDHEDAACLAKVLPARPEQTDGDFISFMSRIRVADLVEAANELGLRIVAVVPYAGIFAGGNVNLWLKNSQADGLRFDRALSWLRSDAAFLEFAQFLELEVFGRLTSRVTSLMMVVLDNVPDNPGNQRWLERNQCLNEALAERIGLNLADMVPEFDSAWRERFNQMLDYPRNRVLLHTLLSAWNDFPGRLELDSFLEPRHVSTLETWRRQDEMDQKATEIPRALGEFTAVKELFTYHGVPLAGGLEYDMTRELLSKSFRAFD